MINREYTGVNISTLQMKVAVMSLLYSIGIVIMDPFNYREAVK